MNQTGSEAAQYERVIKPSRGWINIDFKELWRYRELFVFLAWRDILVRYKQTYLGIAWAVLQPFLTVVVFTIVFGKLGKFPNYGVPYPVLVLAGLLPWQFFANALSESSNSLVASARIISKIYFPRLVIPASTVISGLVDLLVGFLLTMIVMAFYRVIPSSQIVFLPLFLLMVFLAAFAVGFWFSALNVKYRDVKYIVPFIARMGMFISPIPFATAFLAEKIPAKYILAYYIVNPMVGVIDGFRWCILGPQFQPNWTGVAASAVVIALLLISGVFYFRRMEKTFADIV
jgi:lipopolysaccharide transport system permease protein